MQVRPHMTVKQLSEAEPGELVRLKAFRTSALAFVADAEKPERVRLIVLNQYVTDQAPPRYMEINRSSMTVLSYGRRYEILADHAPDAIDIGAARFWELNGVLVLSGTSSLLRVACARGEGYDSVHYDIATGRIVEPPDISGVVLIGKWQLRLAPDDRSGLPGPVLVNMEPPLGQ